MYLCKNEEKIIDSFCSYIADIYCNYNSHRNKSKNNKEVFFLRWANGTQIFATFNTTDEDDNGLEINEKGYEEYYSFIMDIINVVNFSPLDGFDSKWVKKGGSIDFNYHNFPDEIYNSKGELISKKED